MPLTKFNMTLAESCLNMIPKSVEYQVFYNPMSSDIKLDDNKPNVVVFKNDLMGIDEYDHAIGGPTTLSKIYLDWVNNNKNHNFVFVISGESVGRELAHDRIQIVPFVSGMTNQQYQYQQLAAVEHKNLDSTKTFISLNRHPRQHRINLVSYLLGNDLEQHGTISFGDNLHTNNWLERVNWTLTSQQEIDIRPKLIKGYEKSKTMDLSLSIKNVDQIYDASGWKSGADNATNFDQYLRPLYQDHFVEIVAETLCNTPTISVSEKFLNSVYARNFPIMIGAHGLVAFLSRMGFDMFADVVDHSYDHIKDPMDRICAAVDMNMEMLTNQDLVKNLWQANQTRFDYNLNFARYDMYEWYRTRCLEHFRKVTWL